MPFLSDYFHRQSADHNAGRGIAPPPHEWPPEWRTIYYKTYENVPLFRLPSVDSPNANFFELVRTRESIRGKHSKGVSALDLSILLKYSCGLQERNKEKKWFRAQPSAGSLFPLEIYILSLKRENEIIPGIYHYNLKEHALSTLRLRDFSEKDLAQIFTYPWVNDCSMAILMTAVFKRNTLKYGERAYRYTLIEAGHIGQGIYLAGMSRNIGVSGMGGTRDDAIHTLLDIDGTQESLIYATMLSK